jgi:hypothetical protein
MKRMSLLASLLAGAMAFGCSSMRPHENTAQPNAVTGAAGTTGTGIDTTGNPEAGTATGAAGTRAPNPDEQPGLETGETMDSTAEPGGERQLNDVQEDDAENLETEPEDSSY